MIKIELPLKTPITLFAQVLGPDDKIREYRAILNTASTHTVIAAIDAIELGYDVLYDPFAEVGEGTPVITPAILIESKIVTLKEVRVGGVKVRDVEAVAITIPEASGVSMILGTNFLKNFKTTIDYGKGALTIEEVGK